MDPLDVIGESELRAALLFVRGSARPITADDAAAALDVHRSVARSRLERLLRAGLLETSYARLSGRSGPGAGRPAKLYSPAPEMQALEFPPRHVPALLVGLLDELPRAGRAAALSRAGEAFGRHLATAAGVRPRTRFGEGLERVCEALRSLGYQATLDRLDGDTAVIRTSTCPLRPVVAERREATLIDRGMWAGLVARGLRGTHAGAVHCEMHSCLDGNESCTVIIHLEERATPGEPPSIA